MFKVMSNRLDEFGDTPKDAAAEPFLGDVSEEAFHHVQPRRAGRSIVGVKSRMLLHPSPHGRIFVSCVVVDNDMNVLVFRSLVVDESQEFEPFLMAMPRHAGSDDLTVQNVESCKQSSGPVAFVVVSHRASAPFLERQSWLSFCLTLAPDSFHRAIAPTRVPED